MITINESKCNGCGNCVAVCQEGVLGIVNGKAKVLQSEYCDSFGNCLPVCSMGAISFTQKEKCYQKPSQLQQTSETPQTHLNHWPIQIKLVPHTVPSFENADLLVAADCAAYAYGNFHNDYMKDKITLIGCPKLDDIDYTEKLSLILAKNNIKSVTVARMIVPCCGGLERAVVTAARNCGRRITLEIVTLPIDTVSS